MRELDPGPSQIVGPKLLARRFGRGHKWARDLLREWWEEQSAPGYVGPPRCFKKRGRGGVVTIFTTVAVVNAVLPPGRDEILVRAVRGIDKDLDALARKVEILTERLRRLEARR